MTVLTERTRIRTWSFYAPTTTDLIFHGCGSCGSFASQQRGAIDTNSYGIVSGSIRAQMQSYSSELSPKAAEILRKIYKFKLLTEDWDGSGSIAPSDRVIENAGYFLRLADEYDQPCYFTAPGPNGEIVLEYKCEDNTAEIFFEEDMTAEMILYNDNDQVYTGSVDIEKLIAHLDERV